MTRQLAEAGVKGPLCAREACPHGTPCSDRGLERVSTVAPLAAIAVCLVDRKIVWTNARASHFDAGLEHEVVDLVPTSDRPAVLALLTEAAAGRDGIPVSAAIPRLMGAVLDGLALGRRTPMPAVPGAT